MTPWTRVTRAGANLADRNYLENIILCNKIGVIVSILSILFSLTYTFTYTWDFVSTGAVVIAFAGIGSLLLNNWGLVTFSRVYLGILIPCVALLISLLTKLSDPEIQDSEYYEYRFIVLASAVLPFALFKLKEKGVFYSTLLFDALLLVSFDPIHNYFGVGYYQTGQLDKTYYFTNVVVILTYLIISLTLLLVKKQNETAEQKNLQLIQELNETKVNLEERNSEIESQNLEITRQSEVLVENQNKLTLAYETIGRQKEMLEGENLNLEGELMEKNEELIASNAELIRYNNELRQFSFTVSHNLRGPVATLLGLINILKPDGIEPEQITILQHIGTTAKMLDGIINDLNKIIDIRYDIFKVRQRVNLSEEILQIRRLLENRVPSPTLTIEQSLEADPVFSVKPMIHSILYNLISNCIKFRSADRPLTISISSRVEGDYYVLTVSDNGLGIDLTRNGNDLFKLYKRFHHQSDGVGVGLFLTKLQCETLGGRIEVDSELNRFTRFTCYLRKPVEIARQILFDESYARIFYDAVTNSTGVIWDGPITSKQYRAVFTKCVDFLKVYNTPNWISDLSLQGNVAEEDQEWMLNEIVPEACRNGLKRIGVINPALTPAEKQHYLDKIRAALIRNGMEQQFFKTIPDAEAWFQQENAGNLIVP